MRWVAAVIALGLAACGQGAGGAPNEYPAEALAHFSQSCPPESAVCTCTWDRLTRTLTYEEYEAALARFRTEGLMDPRVTRARTQCIEQNPS